MDDHGREQQPLPPFGGFERSEKTPNGGDRPAIARREGETSKSRIRIPRSPKSPPGVGTRPSTSSRFSEKPTSVTSVGSWGRCSVAKGSTPHI
jgi:hypothetical protein